MIIAHKVVRRGKENVVLSNWFGKTSFKAAVLMPILLLSMFSMVPVLTTHVAPNIAKISQTLWNEMVNAGESINVLIKTSTNEYSSVVQQINELGGRVGFQFRYVNGLSASLPPSKIVELAQNNLVERIYYDVEWQLTIDPGISLMERGVDLDGLLGVPTVLEAEEIVGVLSLTQEELASLEPHAYWNPTVMAATPVWAEGYLGEGSLVAIIDTGIWSDHPMFRYTSIIGGIDLSFDVGTDYEGWDKLTNHWHGSHVAGIVAGSAALLFRPWSRLVLAIELYTGVSLPDGPSVEGLPTKILYLSGIAPLADLYIIKVFDHTGRGVPESLVIAGIEHAINLKVTGIYDIDVISMSLGGPTLFDGRDLMDRTIDYATSVGITVVAAAGNEGPASMTTASPGSANTAITVAAAATPVQTRVFWAVYYPDMPLEIGYYLYKTDDVQMIYFSSRGPTSDGRLKPTISATGVFVFSAYPSVAPPHARWAWASGTSMSTPAVSGAVALLNEYSEENGLGASPEDYKQALTCGAVQLPNYDQYDQGAGYLNVKNALDVLKVDPEYGSVAPPLPRYGWLKPIANIPIFGVGTYTASIEDLAPGHKVEYIFYVTHLTDSIRLDLKEVFLGIENPLGLNSFEVYIQSAKRTMYAYYIDGANVWGDASFLITDYETTWTGEITGVYWDDFTRLAPIEPGYVKIVIENDWTSYDALSADITITVAATTKILRPNVIRWGWIGQDEATPWMRIKVPEGTEKAIIQLTWMFDWSKYPTTDLDLYVYWYNGTQWLMSYNGATLNAPERVILEKPVGRFYVQIYGYAIYTGFKEPYQLTIWFIK